MPRSDDEFDAFVRKDHAALVFHLVVLGFHQQLAQDAAQEAVTMLFLKWSTVDNPRAWVRVTGRRVALRLRERELRQQDLQVEASQHTSTDSVADPFLHVQERSEEAVVLEVLWSLPEAQRLVMAWHFDGYGLEEIAELAGKPAATVRSLLRHARNRLRPVWQGKQPRGGSA